MNDKPKEDNTIIEVEPVSSAEETEAQLDSQTTAEFPPIPLMELPDEEEKADKAESTPQAEKSLSIKEIALCSGLSLLLGGALFAGSVAFVKSTNQSYEEQLANLAAQSAESDTNKNSDTDKDTSLSKEETAQQKDEAKDAEGASDSKTDDSDSKDTEAAENETTNNNNNDNSSSNNKESSANTTPASESKNDASSDTKTEAAPQNSEPTSETTTVVTETTEAAHEHTWTPVYGNVHYDYASHIEHVPATYKTVTVYETVCNNSQCSNPIITGHAQEHMEETGHTGYTTDVPVQEQQIDVPEHDVEVVDQEERDISGLVGYSCSCGATLSLDDAKAQGVYKTSDEISTTQN